MNTESARAIVEIVAQGLGVVRELADLAARVKAGEAFTDAELDAAREACQRACERWDAAAENDRQD